MKKCDKCGGQMRLLPWVLCSLPPQYVYECQSCGTKKNVRVKGYEANGATFATFVEEEDVKNV